MKKMKISDSEKRLLVLLGCLILLSGSYFLGFQKYSEKASEIEAENMTDSATLQQLQMMVGRKEEVEQETSDCKQAVEDIIAKYPSDMTTEKAISIIQKVEEDTGAHITAINFTMNNLVGSLDSLSGNTSSAQTQTETGSEPESYDDVSAETDTQTTDVSVTQVTSGGQAGYYASLSMNYEAAYNEFKEMVSYINGLKDRCTVPEISAAYDDATGKLTGTITVNMYYLTETGREYEVPQISGIPSGVSNIFQSGGGGATPEVLEDGAFDENDGETAQ